MYRDATGRWRWSLKADNGTCLAESADSYWDKQACLQAIMLVKTCAVVPVNESQTPRVRTLAEP
jgi:uncharacterized protein YegP (UPF0339 family)